jgi:hypothetical protein
MIDLCFDIIDFPIIFDYAPNTLLFFNLSFFGSQKHIVIPLNPILKICEGT